MIKQKQIQQLFLLLAVLAFASCQSHKQTESTGENKSQKEIRRFIPEEYRFPLNKIGKGKTFVYKKEGALNNMIFYQVQLVTEVGTQYLLVTSYINKVKIDSMKLTTGDKMVEIFSFRSPDFSDTNNVCIRGEIKEDTIIDNGTKLGKNLCNIVYAGKTTKITIKTEEDYLKDTILPWQGKQISCMVVKVTDKKELESRVIPLLSRDIGKNSGEVVYAKGIGRIEFTWGEDGKLSQWQLVDIRDMK